MTIIEPDPEELAYVERLSDAIDELASWTKSMCGSSGSNSRKCLRESGHGGQCDSLYGPALLVMYCSLEDRNNVECLRVSAPRVKAKAASVDV